MTTPLVLLAYAAVLAAAALAVWRRPLAALFVFIPGLALHNVLMAALFAAGVRGGSLNVVQAWKEILLGVSLARVAVTALRERRLPFTPGLVDWLALAFAAVVVLYAVVPQSVLGGEAGPKAILYGLRHYLVPVGAFFVGRSLIVTREQRRALAWTLLGSAAAVALAGFAIEYSLSIEWWRDSHVPAYFRDQLGFHYHGPARLPENFVFNTGAEQHLLWRLVSVFLSPLATGYMLVVALLLAAAWPLRRRMVLAGAALLSSGALLWTFSRSSLLVLAAGLAVLAVARRSAWPAAAAAATVAVALAWTHVYPSVAPHTHFLASDLAYQRENAKRQGGVQGGPGSFEEPSIRSHLTNLRAGLEKVADDPQGFGLGNAGAVAQRLGVKPQAGESNYTEIGVETGIAGLVLFVSWLLVLVARLLARARADGAGWFPAWLAAAVAAIALVAVQTDAWGIPWLALCLPWLAGSCLTSGEAARVPLEDGPADRSARRHRPRAPEGGGHRALARLLLRRPGL